jgi:DNA-binding transcriptional MerR regulator
MGKSADAFKTISEVSDLLDTPTHVLRFWESKFSQIKPVKRAGGRRYYRPGDVALLGGIRHLLHGDGMTIRSVQQLLRDEGVPHVSAFYDPDSGDARESDTARPDTQAAQDPAPSASITPFPSAASTAPVVASDVQPSLFDSGGEEAPMALDVEPEPEPERQVHSLQIKPASERAKPVLPETSPSPDSTTGPAPAPDTRFDARTVAMSVTRADLRARLARLDASRLSRADLRDLRMLALRAQALRMRLQTPPADVPETRA